MATTALIVEVLVVGALALSWIVGAYVVLLPDRFTAIERMAGGIRDFAPLLALPVLALTYAVGWVVNFASERALKPFFQDRVRRQTFGGESAHYESARLRVLQQGSPELIRDLLVDRHIVRLARGGLLNFLCLGVVFGLAAAKGWTVGWSLAAVSTLFATLSFAQWLTRYKSHYKRIRRLDEMFDLAQPDSSPRKVSQVTVKA